jgi:hypothetical protein
MKISLSIVRVFAPNSAIPFDRGKHRGEMTVLVAQRSSTIPRHDPRQLVHAGQDAQAVALLGSR